MKNDIFISYSTADKHTADAICSTLENNGIRCWIAPRDIIPGNDWAQSIINAIKSSKIMVLVFSHNSNESPQVSKELNLAVSHKLLVMPFKIDDSMPSGNMEYFLADTHWLDAIDGDMQAQINRLKDVIKSVLSKLAGEEEAADNNGADTADNNADSFDKNNNTVKNNNNAAKVSGDAKSIGFFRAYGLLWKNFVDFKGCASRSEFWKGIGMHAVVWIVLLLINVFVFSDTPALILIYTLLTIVPFISLCVRRLHDGKYSGYWLLLVLTGYGAVVPFVFLFFESVFEGNKYRNK